MIAALKEQSRIFVASDTMFIDGGQVYYNVPKVWQSEPNLVLIGGYGNQQIVQEVKSNIPFLPDVPDKENCSTYLHNLLQYFKNYCSVSFELLICGSAHIFYVSSTGIVKESEMFECIGPGREIAMAVLEVNGHLGSEARIQQMFEQTIKYNKNVGGKLQVEII